jgi:hypothetical protein
MKTQTQSEQELSSNDMTRTTIEREQSKEKSTSNPKKEDASPVWSPILLRGKSLYG